MLRCVMHVKGNLTVEKVEIWDQEGSKIQRKSFLGQDDGYEEISISSESTHSLSLCKGTTGLTFLFFLTNNLKIVKWWTFVKRAMKNASGFELSVKILSVPLSCSYRVSESMLLSKILLDAALEMLQSIFKHFLSNKRVSSVCSLQNDTKPVKMMKQKTYFPFAFIPEANCQVIKQLISQSIC